MLSNTGINSIFLFPFFHVKNEVLESVIEKILVARGVPNADVLTLEIMDELVKWHRSIAKAGSEKGGRKRKGINMKIVQRQPEAKVPFTAIAASQKVCEGTLRRRLKA